MQAQPKKHDRELRRDEKGAPIIPKVQKHIVTFERMFRYRAQALQDQVETPGVLTHYAAEKAALAAGIATLRYHRAAMTGAPLPLTALKAIVEAYESNDLVALAEAMTQGRGMLTAYAELLESLPANEG